MMIDSVVLAQDINVTDTQTDGQIAVTKCRANALRRAAKNQIKMVCKVSQQSNAGLH